MNSLRIFTDEFDVALNSFVGAVEGSEVQSCSQRRNAVNDLARAGLRCAFAEVVFPSI